MYRIAFLVTRSDHIGGSHVHVRDLVLKLNEDGYDVKVFMGGSGPVIDNFKSLGIDVVSIKTLKKQLSPIGDLQAFFELRRKVKEFDPDLVTAHSAKIGFIGRLVAKSLKIPVTFTSHCWSFTGRDNLFFRTIYRGLEQLAIPCTDKIFAVSEYDKNVGLSKLIVPDDLIITVHNGMPDVSEGNIADHSPSKEVSIIMVARFDHQKDQAQLVKATHKIPNIHLHFVGDGPLRESVEELAKNLNMEDKITFWGEVDTVPELLGNADIFVLTSNWEGFPCSTLEAMRAGLPTIVSDVGGSAEAIEEGVTGYAIEEGNIEQLHKILKVLVNNPAKRKTMGEAARKRYKQLYSFDTMYKKNLQVYSSLINEARS